MTNHYVTNRCLTKNDEYIYTNYFAIIVIKSTQPIINANTLSMMLVLLFFHEHTTTMLAYILLTHPEWISPCSIIT